MCWIKLLFKSIGDVIIHIIEDLKSTRNQLLWLSTWLFCWCVGRDVNVSVLLVIAGLQTVIYAFYFQSKNQEAQHQQQLKLLETKVKE